MHSSLGSKGPSKSQDVPELKPVPALKPLSGSTSKKTLTSLPDRKRDCPSPLQPLRLAKQRKTSSPHSPSVSIDIESSLKSIAGSPVPSVAPIDGKSCSSMVNSTELDKHCTTQENIEIFVCGHDQV